MGTSDRLDLLSEEIENEALQWTRLMRWGIDRAWAEGKDPMLGEAELMALWFGLGRVEQSIKKLLEALEKKEVSITQSLT